MAEDVRTAAKRLIAEAAIAEREMLHMYSREPRPDYLTVAHAALEAVNDRARLLGEVEALKAAVNTAGAGLVATHVMLQRQGDTDGAAMCMQMIDLLDAALDAAPAVAGEATDSLDQKINTAYEEGAENEWASIEAVANEFGDEALLAFIKEGLRSRGWTVPVAPGASAAGDGGEN